MTPGYGHERVVPRRVRRAFLFSFLVACSSPSARPTAAPAAQEPAPAATATAEQPSAQSATSGVPSTCTPSEGACVPDASFVKRLCAGSFPDVALVLFAKDTPFSRMYLRADVDGWNADGGASARARLLFDEEVLVLKRRAAKATGIVVGAGGGYLVLRWDGNCYTLDDNELSTKRPPTPKHASIPWRFYSEPTKNALLQSPKVLAAYQRRGRECKGAMTGEVSRPCEQADAALSAAVVAEIRAGAAIPTPERLP